MQFRRADILRQLYDIAKEECPNVFVNDRPIATQKQMQEFILVRLPQPMVNRAATYQTSFCQFCVFVRDRANGIENTTRLDEMANNLLARFPIVTDIFHTCTPKMLNGGDDSLGFHYLIIQAKIIIRN